MLGPLNDLPDQGHDGEEGDGDQGVNQVDLHEALQRSKASMRLVFLWGILSCVYVSPMGTLIEFSRVFAARLTTSLNQDFLA